MSTPNLAITHITANQNQKEVTANQAFDELDKALTNLVSIAMADANVTLTTGEGNQALANMVFIFTGANTAARNVVVPTNLKIYIVKNGTTGGFKITVKTPSGTGVDILASDGYVTCFCDGTNVVKITGSGGASVFTGLGDVPGSYSGASGKAVEVNTGETALVFSSKPFDVAGYAPGTYTSSQVLVTVPVTRAVAFVANFAGSVASLIDLAATGAPVFIINKIHSGVTTQIGTITIASGGSAGTLASTGGSAQSLAAGDYLQIVAPSSVDATAAGLSFALQGTR